MVAFLRAEHAFPHLGVGAGAVGLGGLRIRIRDRGLRFFRFGVHVLTELTGNFQASAAPLYVWMRTNGELWLISGRHRLAHARKNGVKFIQVRVYDESAERDAQWAKLHDVEQNILDNTCNAIDVAYYFRHNPLTMAEAEARGLLPKTRAGEQTAASRIGLTVAANASDNTFTLLVNGKCTAEDAYMACLIASTEDGQQLALESRAGKNGKKNSWEYVTALVRGAEQMQPADGGMLDLFGNDDAFRESSEKLARYVAAVRDGLKARLNVLMSAGRLNKKGDVSKELGVKVKTPKDATRLIERLANLDAAYERLDPDLGIPAKADAWDGKSAVPTKLDELAGGSSFALSAEMEDIKAAAEKDGTFMKAPNGQPSNLTEQQWLQVRTKAFKAWFGDWERAAELTIESGQMSYKDAEEKLAQEKELIRNDDTGIEVAINTAQRDKMTSPKARRKSISNGFTIPQHNAVVAKIRGVFKHAIKLGDYNDKNNDQNIESIKRFGSPVIIDGEKALAFLTVKCSFQRRKKRGEEATREVISRLYSVELDEIIKLDGQLKRLEHLQQNASASSSKEIIAKFNAKVKEYFENVSKIVDENGEPLVVYHGTPTGGFTIFRDESYFSPLMWYAEKYKNPSASSNRSSRDVGTSMLYEVFLNIRKPFDTRNAVEKKIFESDFFRKWGNGAPLSERGLPDWTDATDLLEFIEENELDYDGLILDEGGYPDGNGGVILRGHSFVPVTPNQIKSATDNRGSFDGDNPDITFSVSDRNLAAVSPEMDARYMEAVKRGDMAAAQRMVNDVARMRGYMPDSDYQGSECFNGAAPGANGYFDTDDERYEAWENGDFEGTVSLADFVRRGMDPGELEWLVTSPGAYQRADQYKRESIEAIRKAKASKRGKVTIYRAVPADIKEGGVRNGDWVTFSKAYAEYHISLQDWEKGRIIKQVVSLDDVWWDGNDVNEWGYDDGKEYAYRNTANNRKLLDAVTYDKNGDIVPLSKRFDYSSPDVSFSVVGEKAANWDKIKHLAFRGRDDGKLRVELDASGAKVNAEALMGKAEKVYEKLIAGWEELPEDERFAVLDYADLSMKYKAARSAWRKTEDDADARAKMTAAESEMKSAKFEAFTALNSWFAAQGIDDVINKLDEPTMEQLAESFMRRRVDSVVRRSLARLYSRNVVELNDVLDFPELFEAYPQLRKLSVYVRDLGLSIRGQVERGWGRDIIVLNEQLIHDEEQMRSTLLHEVQHVIQGIEEFAAGGDEDSARAKYTKLTNSYYRDLAIKGTEVTLRWLNGAEEAKMKLNEYRKALHAGAERGELMRLREEYNDLVSELNNGRDVQSRGYNNWPFEHKYWLPHLAGIEPMYLEILDKVWATEMKSRKRAFPGLEKKMKAKLERLNNEVESDAKLALKLEGKSDFELYQRLAGEIEARNVQLRRDWTAAERAEIPFNESLEYPGEALVSFSLSGRSMIDSVDLGAMAHEEQMQRLMNHARREAARWERTFANGTTNVKAAEAMGTISSIQNAIYKVLPQGYRPELARQMRYVEVYARMLETGRVRAYGKLKPEELAELNEELGELLEADLALVSGGIWYDEKVSKAEAEEKARQMLTREMGAEKLGQAAARLLNAAADSVERWMIDVELERVERMKERLAPRKLPNGKYDKGKMSADAYKEFMRYCELMEMDADAVSTKMQELEALIAAEEQKPEPDADKMDKLASSLAELAAYGNLKGKNLEAVRKGVAALTTFVKNERNVWQGKLELERERTKRAARNMAEQMGHGDEVKLAEKAEMAEGSFQMFNDMGAGFRSLAQMFYGMGGIPGMRELMDESLDALTRGNIQLGLREQRAYDQLGEFMEKKLKLDSETKRNDWMAGLKKKIDTGVQRAGELVTHKLELT